MSGVADAGRGRAGIGVAVVVLGSWLGVARVGAEPTRRALSASSAVGSKAPPARPGDPIAGASAADIERFAQGRAAFEQVKTVATGLGPVFNEVGCNRCHNRKGVGGAGIQSALMAGRLEGGAFDPLLAQGGPHLASASVMLDASRDVRLLIPHCKLPRDGESVPRDANVIARRRTTALFGLGLVDATADATFLAIARAQPPAIRGRAARVENRAQGSTSVGKFGWKAQVPTLHQFSGMALSIEMGITNPEFGTEQAPAGDTALSAACDLIQELEDDGDGVRRLTEFMQLLAPIPPLPQSPEAREGDAIFSQVGCDGCHVRHITSGPSSIPALSQREYAPFSDFLLHDMGSLGDNIGGEGEAAPREMRTAPLWGGHLLGSSRLLHDGRARSFTQAIEAHDGQGASARDAFSALPEDKRQRLLAFLATL